MAATYGVALLGLGKYCSSPPGFFAPILKSNVIIPLRNYAARKGTREKARKKKIKVELKKVEFIPHKLRKKVEIPTTSKRINDEYKPISPDNVWIGRYYQWKLYDFSEAVKCHRETLHPTVFNSPDAPLNVYIELDMRAEKKNRFMDDFTRVISVPYPFDHKERRRIAYFSKSIEDQNIAIDSGAAIAGGPELIKNFQVGAVSAHEFDYIIAHPNILMELVSLRGILKRKFPHANNGTLGINILEMLNRFYSGIKYKAVKDQYEEEYGVIETSVGPISMDVTHLEANYATLVKDIHCSRQRKNFPFITKVYLLAPPSTEKLKINWKSYIELEPEVDTSSSLKEEDKTEERNVMAVA